MRDHDGQRLVMDRDRDCLTIDHAHVIKNGRVCGLGLVLRGQSLAGKGRAPGGTGSYPRQSNWGYRGGTVAEADPGVGGGVDGEEEGG